MREIRVRGTGIRIGDAPIHAPPASICTVIEPKLDPESQLQRLALQRRRGLGVGRIVHRALGPTRPCAAPIRGSAPRTGWPHARLGRRRPAARRGPPRAGPAPMPAAWLAPAAARRAWARAAVASRAASISRAATATAARLRSQLGLMPWGEPRNRLGGLMPRPDRGLERRLNHGRVRQLRRNATRRLSNMSFTRSSTRITSPVTRCMPRAAPSGSSVRWLGRPWAFPSSSA